MAEYKCTVCGYIYDTEKGESRRNVEAGTAWEDVPDDYRCTICGYEYDTEAGEERRDVAAGTEWDDVPADFRCPLCGAVKTMFKAL